MTINYTSLLGLAQPVTGTESGTWGTVVNDEITALLEEAVAGGETIDVTAGNVTLTTTNGAANQARNAILLITGTPGTSRNVVAPSSSKVYVVVNDSNGAIVLKGSATTGVTIAAGSKSLVAWNGSDFVEVGQAGDVDGPSSATDNAVARFDGTTGKLIQNSAVTIADTTGDITGGKYNGLTVSTTTGTFTLTNAKTLAVQNTLTLAGTDSTTMTFPSTSTTVAGLGIAQTFTQDQTITGNLTMNAQGDVRFADSDSSNWVAFQGPATVASNVTWTLPSTDGSNGQLLSTNGTGTLSWATGAVGDVTAAGNNAFTGANTFYNSTGQIFGTGTSTQDGFKITGRAGGSSSYRITFVPATLSSSTTLTFPNVTDTIATIGTAQTFTAAQTFRASNAIRSEAASTQDAIVIAGRAGGTSSYAVTLTPATLSASRTVTLPDGGGNYTVGYLNIPAVGTKTASYTLATTDVGKYVQVSTGGSITIPDATFAEGDVVSVFNNTSAGITITCSITTAYISGTDTDKATVTLATRGVATILFISSTVCVISGSVS